MGTWTLGSWSWRAVKLYHMTFGKLPPVILDLSINVESREILLVARTPKWYLIPWVVLVVFCFLLQLLVYPYILLKCFYDQMHVQLNILEIILCLLTWFLCALVVGECHLYAVNWNNVPFLNLIMSNRLGYSKFFQARNSIKIFLLILMF